MNIMLVNKKRLSVQAKQSSVVRMFASATRYLRSVFNQLTHGFNAGVLETLLPWS